MNKNEEISLKKINFFKAIPYDGIFELLLLKDGRLAVMPYYTYIRIFSLESQIKHEVDIFLSKLLISICQLKSGLLIACFKECSFSVLSLVKKTYKIVFTYTHPTFINNNKIEALTNDRFAVCNEEGIMIWKSKPKYEMIRLLKSDNAPKIYCCLQLNNQTYFTSSEIFESIPNEPLIKIWNLRNYQVETIFKGVGTRYSKGMVEITGNYLLVACENIIIINLKDYKVEKEIKTENNLIFSSFIEMENKLIICKEKKEFLYYFDFKSFELKQLKPHCDPCGPNIVKINNKRFISNNGKLNLTIWEITIPQEQKIIKKK